MIPMMNIIAWSNVVPWAELRQVEQDLIISRGIVDLFSDPFLHEQLRFRGGTALNKLHFPAPIRYSEDIDLVRTTAGSIGPVLDRVRERLEPWLGRANFVQSPVAPKLRFRTQAQDAAAPIRLKVEINTFEIEPTTRRGSFRSASKIRGSTATRIFLRSRARRFLRRSSAPCCSATRDAICLILPTLSTYSRG
jgi:hypothetical protein